MVDIVLSKDASNTVKPSSKIGVTMSTSDKYIDAFVEAFELDDRKEAETLEYQSIENWDSVGHMTLISELEDAFDISMETDDIVEFSSFLVGKEILKKYDIAI